MLSNLLTILFISCISIPILLSNSNYGIEEESICNQKEQIISAFMLSGDTFFQTEQGKIWRMNSTRLNDGIFLGLPYLETKRAKNFERFIGSRYDNSSPIYAFDYKFHYRKVCNDSDTTNEGGTNTCALYDIDNFKSFVCLYGRALNGSKDKTLWDIKTSSYDNKDFNPKGNPIKNDVLKKVVRQFCIDQQNIIFRNKNDALGCDRSIFTGWNIMKWNGTFGKWTDNDFVHLNQFFVCRSKILNDTDKIIKIIYNLYQNKTVTTSSQTYPKNITTELSDIAKAKTGFVIPIAFSGKLYLLNCLKKYCNIRETLDATTFENWTQYRDPSSKPNGTLPKSSTDMSIAKIMRCPNAISYQKVPFDPHDFCKQKSFDSIFSLENDIYFQSNGKFWRYSYLSSTKETLMKIRYDSYTTTLLSKIFNTSRPIAGLTLKIPQGCNRYSTITKFDCPIAPEFEYKLYLTCLYGYNRNGDLRPHPFVNSPSGIKIYPTSSDKRRYELVSRCEAIVGGFMPTDHFETPVSINSNDAFFSKFNESINYPILHNYYHKKDKVYRYAWEKVIVDIKSVTRKNDHWQFHTKLDSYYPPVKDDFIQNISGLFYLKAQNFWISYKRDKQKILMDTKLYNTLFGNFIRFTRVAMKEKFTDLFNCTYGLIHPKVTKMSYSLSTINNPFKWLCEPEVSPYDQIGYSIFNIGDYIYVQKNQRFYRYNSNESDFEVGFLYDKQVSDLLNEIFDTKKRVIGYSFVYFDESLRRSKYRVVLMGKPNWRYIKPFGIFIRKVIYRIFEKGEGPFAPLIPLNSVPKTEPKLTNVLDPVEFFCNKNDSFRICKPMFSMENEDKGHEYQILDAVGYLQLYDENGIPIGLNPNQSSFQKTIFLAFTNTTNRYISKDPATFFTQPLWLLNDSNTFAKKNDIFVQIYGIFSYQGRLYIMAKAKDSHESHIYEASINNGLELIDPEDILTFRITTQVFFNCSKITDSSLDLKQVLEKQKEPPFESIHKSSSSTAMIVVFILLILILVFLVILIGILAFSKYKVKKEKTETDNQNKSKSPSKSNDKSSSESKKSLLK